MKKESIVILQPSGFPPAAFGLLDLSPTAAACIATLARCSGRRHWRNSSICRTCTPRSPILLKLSPANCGTASLIWRKTSSIVIRCRCRRYCLEQIAQNFPIVARLTGRAHRAIQSLQSAFAIDHRAALLGKPERGQNDVAIRWLRSTRISMTMKRGSCASCSTVMPKLHRDFRLRTISALIWPDCTASEIASRFAPGSDRQAKNQSRAVCVWIAIFAQQNVVAWPAARDDVDPVRCLTTLRAAT